MLIDTKFPQINTALDPVVMDGLLRNKLRHSSFNLADSGSWVVGEKRYKPGRSLTINYRFLSPDGLHRPCFATGQLCPPGSARQVFLDEQEKRPELASAGLTYLEDPAMLLWIFPYDRKLKHLQKLLDKPTLARLIAPKLMAMGLSLSAEEISVSEDVLHYLPEQSCMMRYTVSYMQESDPQSRTLCLYGKHYADQTGERTYDTMRQLDGQFAYGARALAYDADIQVLWQTHLPGKPLGWESLTSNTGLSVAELIGQTVAEFHACSLKTDRCYGLGQIEEALDKTLQMARNASPEISSRLNHLIAQLLNIKPQPTSDRLSPLHQDLKLNNFLFDESALGLIDMDCVRAGEAEIDVGSLIANLYLHGLREGSSLSTCHRITNTLTAAYCKYSSDKINLTRLHWHIAAALLHEITRRSLRQLDFKRMQHVQAYLDLSEFFLADRKMSKRDAHVVC